MLLHTYSLILFSVIFAAEGRHWEPVHPWVKDSIPLRVLRELVVSAWPLVLWVAFRNAPKFRFEGVERFLRMLQSNDADLFSWDNEDDSSLCNRLAHVHRPWLYPDTWTRYMLEIDLKIWLRIGDMTRTIDRPRCGPDDTRIRLFALFLRYSFTWSPYDNDITGPLALSFEDSLFTSIDHIVNGIYEAQFESTATNYSLDLSLDSKPDDWVLECKKELCCSVWQTAHTSVLERVARIHLVLSTLAPVSALVHVGH